MRASDTRIRIPPDSVPGRAAAKSVEAHPVERLRGAFPPDGAAQPAQLGEQLDVAADRPPRQQRRILEDVPDGGAGLFDGAGGRGDEAGGQP